MLDVIKVAMALSVALSFCVPCSSGLADEIYEMQAEEADREYPNGWTHRPLAELFTSLSCVYCMSYADPAMDQVIHDVEDDESNPYNVIFFHQPNGGAGDDPFHTEDSNSRMRDHYGQTGTPNAQFDGNYRYVGGGGEENYQDYVTALSESGPRDGDDGEDFKVVDLDIYSEFIGSESEGESGQFKLTVEILYHGLAGDESYEQQYLGESTDLDGTLYVFMVEDGVTAYSSYLDTEWSNSMVFREYAIQDEQFTLTKGESTTYSGVWKVPTTQTDADGVTSDIKIPINPGRMIPIAAVFDLDDTESGGKNNDPSDDTYPSPRSIQSATPQSTIYDNPDRDVPEIKTKTEIYLEDGAEIQTTFDADEGIGTSFVVYNYEAHNYTGEWITDEMKIEGEEVCDEETGICYAYSEATGTSVIPYSEDNPLYYQILFVDGNKTSSKTEVMQFIGADGGANPAEEKELPVLIIGISAIFMALIAGFVVWARRPSAN